MIAGIEIIRDKNTRQAYPYGWQVGAQICAKAADYSVIVRPLADVIVVFPPLTIATDNLEYLMRTIGRCINETMPHIEQGRSDGLE
jgi:adenosylmethionine-8-amino-7-oxononanoate aminotransferase